MYINGVIVGGLDITSELFEEGELQKQLISEAIDSYTPDAIVENEIQLNVKKTTYRLTALDQSSRWENYARTFHKRVIII
jgi:hypothetical protein